MFYFFSQKAEFDLNEDVVDSLFSYIWDFWNEVNFEIPFGEIGLPMESYLYLRA